MNWNDPEQRYALLERVGIERYNEAFEQYLTSSGPIRQVQTRFGRLFAVADTGRAFQTLAQAEAFFATIK